MKMTEFPLEAFIEICNGIIAYDGVTPITFECVDNVAYLVDNDLIELSLNWHGEGGLYTAHLTEDGYAFAHEAGISTDR